MPEGVSPVSPRNKVPELHKTEVSSSPNTPRPTAPPEAPPGRLTRLWRWLSALIPTSWLNALIRKVTTIAARIFPHMQTVSRGVVVSEGSNSPKGIYESPIAKDQIIKDIERIAYYYNGKRMEPGQAKETLGAEYEKVSKFAHQGIAAYFCELFANENKLTATSTDIGVALSFSIDTDGEKIVIRQANLLPVVDIDSMKYTNIALMIAEVEIPKGENINWDASKAEYYLYKKEFKEPRDRISFRKMQSFAKDLIREAKSEGTQMPPLILNYKGRAIPLN